MNRGAAPRHRPRAAELILEAIAAHGGSMGVGWRLS